MKGLNIKRIVAIGLGAALVGSALAPAVMAAAYSNMDQLKKDNIVGTDGMPVVDIVVGSQGLAPDVVWAGNIAAKVAQMAVTPAAGGSGVATVDISVGGVQSTTGSGNTDENVMDYTASSLEFNPIKADYSDSVQFANISGRTIKYSGVESQINIDERVDVNADVTLQTVADGIKAGEPVASIATGGMYYTLKLGTGIPYGTPTNWDDNSSINVKIPMFGKEYVVTEATATKVVMYADTTASTYEVGQSLEVDGVGTYAGKKLTLSLDAMTLIGTAQNYKAQWSLKDGTTVLSTKETSAPAEIRDLFGTSYFTTSVYMSAAGLNASANKYYATIRTGSARVEIRNGEVFPYDSTNTTNPEWKAYIDSTGTALNGSTGRILSIQVKNNWSRTQNKTETNNSKFVLGANDSVMLPNDYAKFTFKGMQTKPMAKAMIGGSNVTITDSKGIAREIPLVISLGTGTNTFTIAGKTYLADVNNAGIHGVNGAIRYSVKGASTAPTDIWGTQPADYGTVGYTTKDVNTANAVGFEIDPDWKSGNVDYYLAADEATSQYWLLLAAQVFDLDSKSDTIQNEVVFAGTEVDQNANNGAKALAASVPNVDLSYYLPDQSTYNVLTAEATNARTNGSGSVLMGAAADANGDIFRSPSDGDTYQYVSFWGFNEGSTSAPVTSDVNLFINNQTGYLVSSTDNKTRIADADKEVKALAFSLDEYTTATASKLVSAVTNFGTTVSVASGVATIMMPEEVRKVEAYVGSNDTVTTTIGGESFTGVKAGETSTTAGGTKVTVDKLTGAGSGYVINDVGTIVKLDTDAANGKSIIVGGFKVNTAAKNLQVDGKTLEERLTASGDYVAAVLTDGKIVVAGWTAGDTAMAARALIAAMDAM